MAEKKFSKNENNTRNNEHENMKRFITENN